MDWLFLGKPLYGGGFRLAFIQASIVYYGIAIILHYCVPALFKVESVQKGKPAPNQVLREAINSIGPLVVKAGVWTVVEHMHSHHIGLLYDGPVKTVGGVAYLLFCIVALDYLHDTWFYWSHRLLHWGPLFRSVHYVHHKSTVPTAFTGYSFHIVEALIVFANEILVCFLIPIHMNFHRGYHMFTTVIHNGEMRGLA